MGGDPTDRDEIIATVSKVMAEMVGDIAGRGVRAERRRSLEVGAAAR